MLLGSAPYRGGEWAVRGGSGAGLLNVWVIDRVAHCGAGVWSGRERTLRSCGEQPANLGQGLEGCRIPFRVLSIDRALRGRCLGWTGARPTSLWRVASAGYWSPHRLFRKPHVFSISFFLFGVVFFFLLCSTSSSTTTLVLSLRTHVFSCSFFFFCVLFLLLQGYLGQNKQCPPRTLQ